MKRKPLDEKGKQFIYQGKAQNFEQEVEQDFEQTVESDSSQSNSLLSEILPEAQQRKEKTQRFCVDLPQSVSKKLAKLSKQSGVPKTEIVRRLLIKALGE